MTTHREAALERRIGELERRLGWFVRYLKPGTNRICRVCKRHVNTLSHKRGCAYREAQEGLKK